MREPEPTVEDRLNELDSSVAGLADEIETANEYLARIALALEILAGAFVRTSPGQVEGVSHVEPETIPVRVVKG
jgi:hypothetical protein